MMQTTLKIEGMSCEHCARAVRDAALSVSGVQSVRVSLDEKTAEIAHSQDTPLDAVKAAIEEEGYSVLGRV